MNISALPSAPPPMAPISVENAKVLLASMNDSQLKVAGEMFEAAKQRQKEVAEIMRMMQGKSEKERQILELARIEAVRREKEVQEQLLQELQKVQQQAILDSLTRQVPITVDVLRSSTSPHSQNSCCSSIVSSIEEDEGVTVKDVIIGKLKTQLRGTTYEPVRPYRPRGSRERVFFESHIFIFDKMSYDAKKRFYRCERKNTCPARIHTPVDSDRVIHRVQTHNHPPPQSLELKNYDIDIGKIRSGYIMQLNTTRSSIPPAQPSSSHLLTPKSEADDEIPIEEKDPSPMDILAKMITHRDDSKKPVTLRLPDLFNQKLGKEENEEIEMALTRFLLQESDLRKEFMASEANLPLFFPDAKKDQLILFVADLKEENPIYELVPVKERNETSIRSAIESFLQSTSTRPLQMSISSKINIPLSQQMIDQWKTEEFIRVDATKPNAWKIHLVHKIDN